CRGPSTSTVLTPKISRTRCANEALLTTGMSAIWPANPPPYGQKWSTVDPPSASTMAAPVPTSAEAAIGAGQEQSDNSRSAVASKKLGGIGTKPSAQTSPSGDPQRASTG